MTTNHWVFGSRDTAWAGPTVFGVIDIVIPAGATLHRFLLKDVEINGTASGEGFHTCEAHYMLWSVDIVLGQYAPRKLYSTIRRIPQDLTALWETTTSKRIYTQHMNSGDVEHGFNVKCSYGKTGGAAFTVRLTSAIAVPAGTLGSANGRAQFSFWALYSTTP